jgi:ABC-2 type transport system permease protein
VVVYILTLVMRIRTNVHPLAIFGVLALIVLGSAVFSTLSLIMACILKTRERFMGMGQVMTMPIFFASNAIYPLSLMPDWLRVVSRANPLTYQVDALRALMLPGGTSAFGLGVDVGVLLGVLVALVWTAARLYPRMVI